MASGKDLSTGESNEGGIRASEETRVLTSASALAVPSTAIVVPATWH